MNRFFEAGRRIVHSAQIFVRDAKRGFTDVDIAETREVLAGEIGEKHVTSYTQRRAQVFSGFHQPPMRSLLSDQLSLVSQTDIQGSIDEVRRIQGLPPEALREEVLKDAQARARRFGLTTN